MTNYAEWFEKARDFFDAGRTRPLAARRAALKRLDAALAAHEAALLRALHADLGKPPMEAYASEIGYVRGDIRFALRRLRRWVRPRRRRLPPALWPAQGRVQSEPRGVVLILAPWNYPLQLALSPLAGALAAGNAAAVKLAEHTPRVSAAVARMIRDAFDPAHVTAFEGGVETGRALLELPFDHVFFTGSTAVGREVMRAAARHPASVTLELGGKNPCIVRADADLPVAARRIAWGKFLNAGQTCVAPDVVFVERAAHDRLVHALTDTVRAFYGDDPRRSPDYGRLVSERHARRLVALLDGGAAACGGAHDVAARYLAPTVLTGVAPDSPLLTEEIFGPILPVVPFDDLDALLARLRAAPAPLAVYLFTRDRAAVRQVLQATRSGGFCVNDTVSQVIARRLPFGGIGASGIGRYHGKAGFDAFSHERAVLERSTRIDPGLAYPPSKTSLRTLKRLYPWILGG